MFRGTPPCSSKAPTNKVKNKSNYKENKATSIYLERSTSDPKEREERSEERHHEQRQRRRGRVPPEAEVHHRARNDRRQDQQERLRVREYA